MLQLKIVINNTGRGVGGHSLAHAKLQTKVPDNNTKHRSIVKYIPLALFIVKYIPLVLFNNPQKLLCWLSDEVVSAWQGRVACCLRHLFVELLCGWTVEGGALPQKLDGLPVDEKGTPLRLKAVSAAHQPSLPQMHRSKHYRPQRCVISDNLSLTVWQDLLSETVALPQKL